MDSNVAKVWTLSAADLNDDDVVRLLIHKFMISNSFPQKKLLDFDDLKRPDPESLRGTNQSIRPSLQSLRHAKTGTNKQRQYVYSYIYITVHVRF